MEPIGPGASARADFSADGVLLVRWASANFDFFRGFFLFLDRFLPVFVPYFALFSSMPCAYLYVNNFFSVSLAWDLHSLQRRARGERREQLIPGERRNGENGTAFNAAPKGSNNEQGPRGPLSYMGRTQIAQRGWPLRIAD